MARNIGDNGRVLTVGQNCWRLPRCRRLAFLIDGKSYFDALAVALAKAQRRIMILGWDFDSRIALKPDREGKARLQLGDFLRRLAETRHDLEIHVLVWRNSFFYGRNIEVLLPLLGRTWWRHPRIHFRFDGHHPVGACQHQKIVTVDDKVAFLGGIDLTQRRWDDSRHAPENVIRCTVRGNRHAPSHDIQAVVDGDAAKSVAEIARSRWQLVAKSELPEIDTPTDPWPETVKPQIGEHAVAVARTLPAHGAQPPAREIAALNIDMLAAARRSIYLETQYFALPDVTEMLARRLDEPNGPEVVIVTNGGPQGRFERYVMGKNRNRMFAYLHAADRYGRLRTFYPQWKTEPPCCIKVHSKLVVVDDWLLRIGSSNLNARSLGFDTECDIALEAQTEDVKLAIAALRDRLLAEHLGCPPPLFSKTRRDSGSLVRTIDRLNGRSPRMLMAARVTEKQTEPLPASDLLDPRRPFSLRHLLRRLTSL